MRQLTRPVLKHGPRSLECAQVKGLSKPQGETKVNRKTRPGLSLSWADPVRGALAGVSGVVRRRLVDILCSAGEVEGGCSAALRLILSPRFATSICGRRKPGARNVPLRR